MKTSEVLKSTLEEVNKNNAITVSFSNYEKVIIKNMMKQYAVHCIRASFEEAYKTATLNLDFYESSDYEVLNKSITKESNIILL